MFDLSLPSSVELPLLADVLMGYTLEFEIRVEWALTDLRECLREVIRDKDCCRELANTLMEDIEEIGSVQDSELATHRAELDRRGPSLPSTKTECIHLRSWVTGLEDELADLTQRFATLDHSRDKERATLEADRGKASS